MNSGENQPTESNQSGTIIHSINRSVTSCFNDVDNEIQIVYEKLNEIRNASHHNTNIKSPNEIDFENLRCECKIRKIDNLSECSKLNDLNNIKNNDYEEIEIVTDLKEVFESPQLFHQSSEFKMNNMELRNNNFIYNSHVTGDSVIKKKIIQKSIFDLDYDDTTDDASVKASNSPIQSISVDRQHNSKTLPIVQLTNELQLIKDDATRELCFNGDSVISMRTRNLKTNEQYEVIGDEICPIKKFEKQRINAVNEYHIQKLHSFYIPNVNGNWSNGPTTDQIEIFNISDLSIHSKINNKKMLEIDVVPRFGFRNNERIPKHRSISVIEMNYYEKHNRRKSETTHEANNFFGKSNLQSFNQLTDEHQNGQRQPQHLLGDKVEEFREWHELFHAESYNSELLTILPYVVID